jgi:hypothetical protein
LIVNKVGGIAQKGHIAKSEQAAFAEQSSDGGITSCTLNLQFNKKNKMNIENNIDKLENQESKYEK